MPVGEIAGELLGGAIRLIANVLMDVVFEILVKGLGYIVCRPFSKSIDPDGVWVAMAGLLAWLFIGFTVYVGYSYMMDQIDIDRCLDLGGSYDRDANQCIQLGPP